MMSPSGASILITSAPRSPRICVANGPRTTVVRSSTLIPASGPGRAALSSCIAGSGPLPRLFADPEEERDAGDDVPQPPLQHLAQNPGTAARQGGRAHHHRIPEDTLHGGTAEKDPRPAEDAGQAAGAEEGGRGGRCRSRNLVRRRADRGDGPEPDHC